MRSIKGISNYLIVQKIKVCSKIKIDKLFFTIYNDYKRYYGSDEYFYSLPNIFRINHEERKDL